MEKKRHVCIGYKIIYYNYEVGTTHFFIIVIYDL